MSFFIPDSLLCYALFGVNIATSTFWLVFVYLDFKKCCFWGTWVAQSVEPLTLAQVMISWFVSSSPVSGFVLTAQSLEPASDSVSPSLSAPPSLALCLLKINKYF